MSKPPVEEPAVEPSRELEAVLSRRRHEAREAGMSLVEAKLFSESDIDVGDLRRLVKLNWPPDQIAKVLL